MQRFFFCFIFLVLFNEISAQQININPSIVEFSIASPSASETQIVLITNNSTKTQSFELSLGDWNRKTNGSHEYFAPNTQPFSCASWLTIDKSFIEIQPGKVGEVVLTIQSPKNAEELNAMKWAMLFIQSANLKKPITNGPNEARASIQEIVRMGIHVYQTPPSLVEAKAAALSLKQADDNIKVYDFEMQNTGKVMINCKSHLEITNLVNSTEVITETIEYPVFPGGKRIIPLEIPVDIKKGKYSILAVLDYGDNNPLEAIEKTIEIK